MNNVYYLNGDMDSNSYQEISDLLSHHQGQSVTIVARSNGGKLVGLEGAMDAIRAHGRVQWVVPSYSHCYSACAVLGLSSSKIDGALYFHSIYSSYKNTTFQLMGRNESVMKRLISYGYDTKMVEGLFGSVNIYKKLQFNDGVLQPQEKQE
ncbi:MAG: hypothetical protein RLZZ410_1315 [Pseudomonadota bacterium]